MKNFWSLHDKYSNSPSRSMKYVFEILKLSHFPITINNPFSLKYSFVWHRICANLIKSTSLGPQLRFQWYWCGLTKLSKKCSKLRIGFASFLFLAYQNPFYGWWFHKKGPNRMVNIFFHLFLNIFAILVPKTKLSIHAYGTKKFYDYKNCRNCW